MMGSEKLSDFQGQAFSIRSLRALLPRTEHNIDRQITMSDAHKDGLGLLSWNINDNVDTVLGLKSSTDEFLKHLNGQQIFCLQETKSEIKIPNYKCYNKLRSDSRSGGLCIGIHRDYQHLAEHFDTKQRCSHCI